eukprot:TRINITY_DN1930_c0_g1_i1.p1 TRINITY_DN1930_c0_g1~~TRINITY_DN1930_c0_g1_i1.p1  ORF type:complete len:539 (-),score=67.71 TRINITY_DN1930_c0_g1_i1:114-1730(-)
MDKDRMSLTNYGTVAKPTDIKLYMGMPSTSIIILLSEACERFAYYGMKGILQFFLTERMDYSESNAISVVAGWTALCYFSPLLGGYLSDSYFGKFRIIVSFSIVYVIGLTLLSVASIPEPAIVWMTFLALFCIGMGTGGIKPCVSSFGADQIELGPTSSADSIKTFFHGFYWCINFGSLFAYLAVPTVQKEIGFDIAFALPAVLLLIATILVVIMRTRYIHTPIKGSVLATVARVTRTALGSGPGPCAKCCRSDYIDLDSGARQSHWLDSAEPVHGRELVNDVKAVFRILPVFAVVPFFWTLYDQASTTWVFQARQMKRYIGSYEFSPAVTNVFNPLCILIMLPLFDRVVYPTLKRFGIPSRALDRMLVGMLITGLAFGLSGFIQLIVEKDFRWECNSDGLIPGTGDKLCYEEDPTKGGASAYVLGARTVPVYIQIPQILLITWAEILVSTTGLEFAYSQAPTTMKAAITALWLTTVAIGNLLTASIYQVIEMFLPHVSWQLFFFAGLMIIPFVCFIYFRVTFIYAEDVKAENDVEKA